MNRRTFLSGLAVLPFAGSALTSARIVPPGHTEDGRGDGHNHASMWIYLWDLADEGYENVLTRLKDHGLTAVSLACAYHAGKLLLPHNPKRKVVFLEDGTIYFRPRMQLYGRIKPQPNTLVREGHSLAVLQKHAEKAGIETRAWVVCCHNTSIGLKYPDIVCRNAFGDRVYHNLCPSNADVREYVAGLTRDLALSGVSAIELEALQFQGYSHGFHHEREGIVLDPPARFLLGLCFCGSCSKRAADARIDIGAVKAFARETLEEYFRNPGSVSQRYATIEDLPRDMFDPFFHWRASVIVSFIEELAQAIGPARVQLRPMISLDPATQHMAGIDPTSIAAVTGGVLALGYVKEGSVLRTLLSQLQSRLGEKQITLGLQVGLPESGGKPEFLERMRVGCEARIRSYNFYNYGLIPLGNLEWIGEALAKEGREWKQ